MAVLTQGGRKLHQENRLFPWCVVTPAVARRFVTDARC